MENINGLLKEREVNAKVIDINFSSYDSVLNLSTKFNILYNHNANKLTLLYLIASILIKKRELIFIVSHPPETLIFLLKKFNFPSVTKYVVEPARGDQLFTLHIPFNLEELILN